MANNIMILGGGGREHAIARAIKNSKNIKHISCAPGNPGINKEASCHIADPTDLRSVLDLAKRIKPDLVIIGPEAPLAAGIADALRRYEYKVFGPNQRSAFLESSKIFAKNFMVRHSIPTAGFKVCVNSEEMRAASADKAFPLVVKADGLAAGKGVRVCKDENEYNQAAMDFFEKKILGEAANKVLIEDFIDGSEMSVLALVSGGKFEVLPVAQDYKRLQNGNVGPNTGGMGSYAPMAVPSKIMEKIIDKIIHPTLKGMVEEKLEYCGVLYFGLMIREGEPYLIEYNVRFGDPEVQVILPLLDGDWAEVFSKVANGDMPKLKWKNLSAVCVVIAAPGYPDNPQKGLRVIIDREYLPKVTENCYFLHAGTASHNGYITSGGRVLNIVSVHKSGAAAREKAFELVPGVLLEGMQFRTDIAQEFGPAKASDMKQTKKEKEVQDAKIKMQSRRFISKKKPLPVAKTKSPVKIKSKKKSPSASKKPKSKKTVSKKKR